MKTYEELKRIGIKRHAHSDGKWYPSGTLLYIITNDGEYWTRVSGNMFRRVLN
jgi:hypothetical protein